MIDPSDLKVQDKFRSKDGHVGVVTRRKAYNVEVQWDDFLRPVIYHLGDIGDYATLQKCFPVYDHDLEEVV